jgi:hypothetical protein
MKRFVFLICLLSLLLTGCTGRETVYTTEVNGVTYTVDTETGTITGAGITCRYTVSNDEKSVSIRFPDGTTWQETKRNNGTTTGSGSVSATYLSASSVMADLAWDTLSSEPNYYLAFAAVATFGIGIWTVRDPHGWWRFSRGWMVKNVEPSDHLLVYYQIVGVVLVLASVVMFITSLAG